MSVHEVHELMRRAYELPYGEARTVLIEDAARRAEATGDRALTFRVRMDLGSAYQYGGEPGKTFTTFSRCLAEYDRDPSGVGEYAEHRLLWQFKWIVHSLTLFPEVPLDRTRAVLDDMERRYRLGGHSLHAVYARRARVAQHLGDAEEADRWYAMWHSAPRDELSDCIGCDPSSKAGYLAWRGRDDEALAVAEPVLRNEFDCAEQPQDILTELLPVYLRMGRHEQAADAHRRAYRAMRTRLSELSSIADHVEFCARSGNEARGLEILERHLGWLDRAPSPHAGMSFAAAGALVLRRLAETGHGDLTVRRPGRDDEITLDALRAELAAHALGESARFDARNGTSQQGDLVRALLAAEPLTDHVPLSAHARRPAPAAPPPAPVAAPATDDPDELLDAAEEHWIRRETAGALAAWRRFDARVAELGLELTPMQAGRRADGSGFESLVDGDLAAALSEWERAAALYETGGERVREHSAHSRRGALLCDDESRSGEGLSLLEAAVTYLDEHASHTRPALAARLRLARAYVAAQRPGDAPPLLDGLETGWDGNPVDLADVDMARAWAHALLDDAAESKAALERACAGYREAGATGPLAEASLMLGQRLAHEAGADNGATAGAALSHLDQAVAHAPHDHHGLRSAAHATRGSLLLGLGRFPDATEDFVEAVAGFTASGDAPQAASARLDLAVAYFETGRHLEAAEAVEEALPIFVQLGATDHERRGRLLQAQAQRELGEREEAAETYTALAEDEQHPINAAHFLESAADILAESDKDGLAAERFLAAAEAFATAGDPYGVVRTRRRAAMSLSWSGNPEEGLTKMTEARAALANLPQDNEPALIWETALVSYDEARLLANAGRLDEARTRADEAIAGFTRLEEKEAAETAARLRSDLDQT